MFRIFRRLHAYRQKIGQVCALVMLGCCPYVFADNASDEIFKRSLDNPNPERILFVGNSYLYYGDSLHSHVRRLAVAANPVSERFLEYRSATISGAKLEHHSVENYLLPGKLGLKKPFQAVVLQGHSRAVLSPASLQDFKKVVKEVDQKIRAAGSETVLYMTPAYTEKNADYDPAMLDKIKAGYLSAANQINALVIPVGIAFEQAYRLRPDLILHKGYDGSHPDLLGTYLAACVTYAALYNQSVLGNSYRYFGAIDLDTAIFLQGVADSTVRRFFGG